MARRATALLTCAVAAFVLTSCAAAANESAGVPDAAGFWMGVWHGLILPIAFAVSLFNDNVGVYEVRNNGAWYNLGFVLSVMLLAGGGGGAAGRNRS